MLPILRELLSLTVQEDVPVGTLQENSANSAVKLGC